LIIGAEFIYREGIREKGDYKGASSDDKSRKIC
jgi:hypothetical protein